MKKIYFIFIMIFSVLLLSGCAFIDKREAKKAIKEKLTTIYKSVDETTTIKYCVGDYNVKEEKVVYSYCVSDEGELYYAVNLKYTKGSKGYDGAKSVLDQVLKEVDNPPEGYYAFKFEPSELK